MHTHMYIHTHKILRFVLMPKSPFCCHTYIHTYIHIQKYYVLFSCHKSLFAACKPESRIFVYTHTCMYTYRNITFCFHAIRASLLHVYQTVAFSYIILFRSDLRMYVCMYVCLYVCLHICASSTRTKQSMHIYVCMYVCV